MSEFYKKLVDMYAGKELPAELNDQMELAAHGNPSLMKDMVSLSKTVELLKADSAVSFSEDSYQRILAQIYAQADAIPAQREESSLQYHLPIPI